ncbi:hypothetical protein [Azospirillum himalayense]|uniref:Uncharacterized protein n=1 Tax=Azospirillum himalayense TaxID=654847 RepID=A0ABW0G600_9PROT
MPDLPLTLDNLKAIAAIVLGCLTLGATVGGILSKAISALRRELSGQIKETRTESAEGRKRVHERIDGLRDHIDANFVRRDTYDADQRAVQHALTETNQIIAAVAAGRPASTSAN